MPDKEQLIQRRIQELNHASRISARDFICEKVDLEAMFREKNLGYASPSGWGDIYMANKYMLRGGSTQSSLSLPEQVRATRQAKEGGDDEWITYNS